jgi:predicted Zn finger-like uncharacterized protein
MKFTCDSCSAQYMISDEKVGPSGVKVRCKKCGNVILVRRAADLPAQAPAAAPAGANGAAHGNGLDAELGQAFDNAFGDPPAAASAAAAAAPGASVDPGSTQLMGSDDAARIAAAPAPVPAPAETEWYVAIGQAQVGPLPLAEVKKKWEAGDIGPDSLVWRPGMGDWQPLSSQADLAGYLAPVPRVAPAQAARTEPLPARAEPQPAREAQPAAVAPSADVNWKPVGASALAALASEEIAARAAPEPRPAPARAPAVAGGARSLMDALPDGGGVDPTGAIPLSIKGLEKTGEKRIERRSMVASRAEETRHRRSVARMVAIGVVVVIVAVGGVAAYVLTQMKKLAATPAAPVAAVQPPAPAPAAPAPVPAAPPAAAPSPAVPAVAPQPVVAAAPAAAAPVAPAPAKPASAEEPPRRVAKAEPPRPARKESQRREPPASRGAVEPPEERAPPPPAPTPAPAKKKDGLLDFDSSDSALDEALGGGSSGRSVYVPPARAGAPALPDKLSPAQINEAVAGRIDSLRKCVSDQKARDPSASGVLKMRWIIGGDGNVRDVKTLSGEYATSPFAQCITGVVKSIRFPRSQTAGQEVTFPFSF